MNRKDSTKNITCVNIVILLMLLLTVASVYGEDEMTNTIKATLNGTDLWMVSPRIIDYSGLVLY